MPFVHGTLTGGFRSGPRQGGGGSVSTCPNRHIDFAQATASIADQSTSIAAGQAMTSCARRVLVAAGAVGSQHLPRLPAPLAARGRTSTTTDTKTASALPRRMPRVGRWPVVTDARQTAPSWCLRRL